QECRHPPLDLHRALLGLEDSRHRLEQRALARPIRSDDSERRTARDLEVDALERPELLVAGASSLEDRRLEVLVALVVEAVALPEVVHGEGGGHGVTSLADARDRTNHPPVSA